MARCDFCLRTVPQKCANVFVAIKCQKDRADKNQRKLNDLEEAAMAFYDCSKSFLVFDPNEMEVCGELLDSSKRLAELLGDDVVEEPV